MNCDSCGCIFSTGSLILTLAEKKDRTSTPITAAQQITLISTNLKLSFPFYEAKQKKLYSIFVLISVQNIRNPLIQRLLPVIPLCRRQGYRRLFYFQAVV